MAPSLVHGKARSPIISWRNSPKIYRSEKTIGAGRFFLTNLLYGINAKTMTRLSTEEAAMIAADIISHEEKYERSVSGIGHKV